MPSVMVQSIIIKPGALFNTVLAGADVLRVPINLIMSGASHFLTVMDMNGDSEEASGKWWSLVYLLSYSTDVWYAGG